jgi:hypothetical protein
MAHQPQYSSHGNTPAMWTACTIIMIASLVGGLGVIAKQQAVFWVGVALVVVALVVGYVMSLMGYGQPRDEPHTLPLPVDEDAAEAADPSKASA